MAIYIGGGEAIGFGSDPIRRHEVKYRDDFLGYQNFALSAQEQSLRRRERG